MNKLKFYYLIFLINLFVIPVASAQRNVVSVSQPTGSASVVIPITGVSVGSISVPVSLFYNATGVRVKDVEGAAGLGWHLQAGGQISRIVRGLPDDVKKDLLNNDRKGWLQSSANSNAINSFTPVNTTAGNYSNEQTDLNYINANINKLDDTEPDLFSVNAPGLSFQFVFDGLFIRTIPYQDVKVLQTVPNATTGLITAFTVYNDRGVKYEFAKAAVSEMKTIAQEPEASILYFKTKYDQYKNGIRYVHTWHLSKMTDPNGNVITFDYDPDTEKESANPIKMTIGNTSTPTTLYYEVLRDQRFTLKNIIAGDQSVEFVRTTNAATNQSVLNSINTSKANFLLNYTAATAPFSWHKRFFLRDVTTDQCDVPFKYHFDYIGDGITDGQYTTTLPDSSSSAFDLWGYYKGNYLYPDFRAADPAYVPAGSLNKVTYFDGGSTSLVYESNSYTQGSTEVNGGGLRIKTITDHDGISSNNDIVRNYSYTDPSTGLTSGKPAGMPEYFFKRPYADPLLQTAIVTSEDDLDENDHSIYYSTVKVSQTGAGSTVYNYSNSGMFFDATGPYSWTPTVQYTARTNSAQTMGWAQTASNYPFAPRADLGFERGLLTKVTAYNESNVPVSETSYTYQSTNNPYKINALRVDQNNYAISYAKYQIYAGTGKLIATTTQKIFDPGSSSVSQNSSTTFNYNSTKHKLPTSVATTNSDNIQTIVNTVYSKDYLPRMSTDVYGVLQANNINIPVEQYKQVGGITVSAQLTEFNGVGMPLQTFLLNAPNGIGDFQPAYITADAMSQTILAHDSRYVRGITSTYGIKGVVERLSDNSRHDKAIISDMATLYPVAVFDNAALFNVACNNFELMPATAITTTQVRNNGKYFTKTGTYNYVADRSSANNRALALPAGTPMTVNTLSKAQSQTEVFSCWLKSASSGILTVTLTDVNNQQTNKTIAYVTNAGNWKYYEVKIPLGALAGVFNVAFQTNTAVEVDDILFYPASATVSTITYDNKTGNKLRQTNTNGITEHYSYDAAGRLALVADKDKNIKLRNSYYYRTGVTDLAVPTFVLGASGAATPLYTGSNLLFQVLTTYNVCNYPGISFNWVFGDGTTQSSTSPSITHSYASAGTYNITCTVSAPGFTSKTYAYSITVETAPPPPVVPPPPATITGSSQVAGINFFKVELMQNSAIVQTITAAQISGVNVPEGTYTVKVYIDVPDPTVTYGSIYASAPANGFALQEYCVNYSKTPNYTFLITIHAGSLVNLEIRAESATCVPTNALLQ